MKACQIEIKKLQPAEEEYDYVADIVDCLENDVWTLIGDLLEGIDFIMEDNKLIAGNVTVGIEIVPALTLSREFSVTGIMVIVNGKACTLQSFPKVFAREYVR